MRGSQFNQLRALATIAKEGSFARAAAQLQMSRSALSQVIRTLEEQLGVQLLNRTTRSVAVTEAGSRLLARINPALAELQSALEDVQIQAGTLSGTVRVHTQRLAYHQFVSPRLGAFCQHYPDIKLDIVLDDAPIDIVAAGFDLGIRLSELLDQDAIALKLGGEIRQIAAASPGYIAQFGAPKEPKDLHRHRCIGFRWPGEDAIYNWEFVRNEEWFSVAIPCALVLSDQRATLEAAAAGAGIAFWAESEVRPFIDRGALVPLLEDWSGAFQGFYCYFPKHRQRSTAMAAFLGALRQPLPAKKNGGGDAPPFL
jgi:DNA-binding transcriptional LysR family regulator